MSSYCLCVHRDKLVPSFPIVLPVFSFSTPPKFSLSNFPLAAWPNHQRAQQGRKNSTILIILLLERNAGTVIQTVGEDRNVGMDLYV